MNVSYQREKRNRENIEEEYKKVHTLVKLNEENKIQLISSNESLKKDIQLYQETNRINEVSYYFILMFFFLNIYIFF